MPGGVPFRFTAYDGSATGPEDSPFHVHLDNERGLSYLLTAPGDLGLARAYVSGDLTLEGVHPGDPYDADDAAAARGGDRASRHPRRRFQIVRGLGWSQLRPPPPPPQETLPRWRRVLEGLRHSKARDADAIHHHYDVSNRFYELVLGPSMTYTCAVFPSEDATLEEAQFTKYDLVCRKLGLQPGMRLLDVGSGWGGMVRHAAKHYGVAGRRRDAVARAGGLGARRPSSATASTTSPRSGSATTATSADTGFDAVSSIGLTEHIGVRNYPAYFALPARQAGARRPAAQPLHHPLGQHQHRAPGAFIDRYVFPDGELTGSGRIITEMQDAGLEVRHEENLREHYALTLKGWSRNLVDNWDECVREVGEGTAKVWGIYMAGSRRGFERNEIQLHQVLAVKPDADGSVRFPLRPDWLG